MKRSYDMQLLDLYQKSTNQEKYAVLLKDMVLTEYAGNMELYRTLKEKYEPEEWKDILQELLNAPAWERYLELIFAQEKMTERLIEAVCRNGSLYMAEKYTDDLKEEYPEELLDIYERELQKTAKCSAGRSAYREWAKTLRKMKEIPGGEERVQQILRGWRSLYSFRPAMMDELRRV